MSKMKKNQNESMEQIDEKMRQLGIIISDDVYSKLRILSLATESTISQVVREIIYENIDKRMTKHKDKIEDLLSLFKSIS